MADELKNGIDALVGEATKTETQKVENPTPTPQPKKEKSPLDYEGVKATPYGFIYNVGKSHSITDVNEQDAKLFNKKIDPNAKKRYSYQLPSGDEVYADSFEEAYNKVMELENPKPKLPSYTNHPKYNKNFDIEKYGKYFLDDGTLNPKLEDEYFKTLANEKNNPNGEWLSGPNSNDMATVGGTRNLDGTLKRDKELNDMIKALDYARSPDEKYDIEQGIIQREEELKRGPSYKTIVPAEDLDDARYYPTESTMDKNNRWVGRYHSIYDAFDGTDKDDFRGDKFKPVGDYNGISIYQLPDGYFSTNPRITDMSFKSKEALQNYLDKKNPEEHKYGVYFENGNERVYKDKDSNGKEYDIAAPDAYKKARTYMGKQNASDEYRQNIESKREKLIERVPTVANKLTRSELDLLVEALLKE